MQLLTTQVKDKIKECEIALLGIPTGLTLRLQPLDISVNKFLKKV